MSEFCAVCQGYESDGEDYIKKDKCSECQEVDCTCSDCECADCADWLSEAESERECETRDETSLSVTPQVYADSESDVEDSEGGSGSESVEGDEFKETGTKDSTATKELLVVLEREKKNKQDTVITKNEAKEDETRKPLTDEISSSDEEQKYPQEILQRLKNRPKRETSRPRYGRHHTYERSSRHHGKSRRRRGVNTFFSKIMMPSRKIALVTIPQAKRETFKCGDKTRLITLRPHGTMGRVEYSLIANEMEKTRRKHRSGAFSGYNIISIQKIVNPCLWKRYRHRRREVMNETKYSNERLLFHGSPSYNTIIETGMDERYATVPRNMFGAGLYFASNSSKSNQYSLAAAANSSGGCVQHQDKHCKVCERVLLLCRVILGNMKVYTTAQVLAHPPTNYHSVKGAASAGGLQYDEYIVYRGEQVYPEFIIKYTLKP